MLLLRCFYLLVVILIYLGFRFKFVFAIGAVAALFHDVLITLGLYACIIRCYSRIKSGY